MLERGVPGGLVKASGIATNDCLTRRTAENAACDSTVAV
jgi:hypothetical protein